MTTSVRSVDVTDCTLSVGSTVAIPDPSALEKDTEVPMYVLIGMGATGSVASALSK